MGDRVRAVLAGGSASLLADAAVGSALGDARLSVAVQHRDQPGEGAARREARAGAAAAHLGERTPRRVWPALGSEGRSAGAGGDRADLVASFRPLLREAER